MLDDRDTDIARGALAWAEQEGKLTEATAGLQASLELSDGDIDRLMIDRQLT